jgi:hypothetical protein
VGLLDRLLGRKSGRSTESAAGYQPADPETLELVWEGLRGCPICGAEFGGHHFALVGTTILSAGNRRRIEKFLLAVERKLPGELTPFHDWDAGGENAEAYAVRCIDGNIAIAVAHTAAAAPHFKNVIRCDSLGAERSRELETIVAGERWVTVESRLPDRNLRD